MQKWVTKVQTLPFKDENLYCHEQKTHEQTNFVRGDRILVKKDRKKTKDYYYLYNGHGDVIQIVDTSGNVVNNYVYDEWGTITSQTEGITNSFKYAGESYDSETGLYYLRARYYDPSTGRFINEDTYEGQIDNPLSQNLYTYVHNNPLIYVDPMGHAATIDGSAFETRTIGSNGVLYINNGTVAWDYYLAWRNSDKLAFDKLANSGKGISQDQMMVMRMTLSFFAYVEDGSIVLMMESNGQGGLAEGIMEKYGVKAGTKIVVKGTGGTTANGNKVMWGSWSDYKKVTFDGQEYALVGDRLYSRHAVDRMQPSGKRYSGDSQIVQAGGAGNTNDYGRGVSPNYVEEVIRNTKPVVQQNGNLSYTSGSLQVITNPQGAVVTIITK